MVRIIVMSILSPKRGFYERRLHVVLADRLWDGVPVRGCAGTGWGMAPVSSIIPRLLVIAAHPDDETLGCGGTIARTVREGGIVHVVICTRVGPFLSRYPKELIAELDVMRREEAQRACRVLGVRSIQFGDFEEVHLASRPLPTLVDFLRGSIADTEPTMVLSHHWVDLHQDHRVVAEATQIALRPYMERTHVTCLLAYTVDPSHWLALPRLTYFSVLTAEDLETKSRALDEYKSEICEAPHPRSRYAIEAQAMATGVACGKPLAEAFELVWARAPETS